MKQKVFLLAVFIFLAGTSSASVSTHLRLKNIVKSLTEKEGNTPAFAVVSPPTVQASNIVFTNNLPETITVNWTKGNGAARVVLINYQVSGPPPLVNNTTYQSGARIGSSSWFCIYNGTGSSFTATVGMGETAQFMTMEYNGTAGNEQYLSDTATGNPASVLTMSNNVGISNVKLNGTSLRPTFISTSNTACFFSSVPANTTSVNFSIQAADPDAVVKLHGTIIANGGAPKQYPITAESNDFSFTVTATDGITTKTYPFVIVRSTIPPSISYNPNTLIFKQGVAITPVSPSNSGGGIPYNGYGTTSESTVGRLGGYIDGELPYARYNNLGARVFDSHGNIFIADAGNNVIRKIDLTNNIVSTFAGTAEAGFRDGPGVIAQFNNPKELTIDAADNLYVADYANNRIRKVTPAGVVTTFAGSGAVGNTNGNAAVATFNNPAAVCFDNMAIYMLPTRAITLSGRLRQQVWLAHSPVTERIYILLCQTKTLRTRYIRRWHFILTLPTVAMWLER